MKAIRRFKRKLRALKAQKVALLREMHFMQARYGRLATRLVPPGAKKQPGQT